MVLCVYYFVSISKQGLEQEATQVHTSKKNRQSTNTGQQCATSDSSPTSPLYQHGINIPQCVLFTSVSHHKHITTETCGTNTAA